MPQNALVSMLKVCAMTAVMAFTGSAQADDLDEASLAMCEHVKACAVKNMQGAEGMPPEMHAMMMQSMNSMCDQMKAENPYSTIPKGHALYDEATACMRSMARLSCDELMNDTGRQTAECDAVEKAAQQYE